jgi:hypothetical protein
MKYMRKTVGYTSTVNKINTDIAKELNKPQFWTKYMNTEEIRHNI